MSGFMCGPNGCRELPEEVAAAIRERAEQARAKRAADMPDEGSAIRALFEAHFRLRELGWRDAMYMPKDGRVRQVIEVGSTGIHQCTRDDEGRFWIHDGDTWPSRPCLYRPSPKKHPDCVAVMCGETDCGKVGPCYARVSAPAKLP